MWYCRHCKQLFESGELKDGVIDSNGNIYQKDTIGTLCEDIIEYNLVAHMCGSENIQEVNDRDLMIVCHACDCECRLNLCGITSNDDLPTNCPYDGESKWEIELREE